MEEKTLRRNIPEKEKGPIGGNSKICHFHRNEKGLIFARL